MAIKRTFQEEPEGAIASYDFEDIATGEGFVNYYCGIAKYETTETYVLTRETQFFSSTQQLQDDIPTNTSAFTKIGDYDFDLSTYKKGQIFDGNGHIVVTVQVTESADAEMYFIFKVRSWNSTTSTETDLAQVQSETVAYDASNASTLTVPITINKKSIKTGENLRFTIETWGKNTSAIATGRITFKTDPSNRNGTTDNPTYLKVSLAKRIDLA